MRGRWLACLLPGLWQCTLLYADLPSGQCAEDADCADELGIQAGHCDVARSVCVRGPAPMAESLDSGFVCRGAASPGSGAEPDRVLEGPLSSRECSCMAGDWQDPDALVIGTLAPHTFRTASGARLQIPFVPRWLQSIELALEEWQSQVPNARLRRSGRPLALLHCNSNDDLPQARRALAHLTDVAQAPIVLTLTDNDTIAVRRQALHGNVSVLCSMCFSRAPVDPAETSLIWQSSPALIDQAPLAAWRVAELASELRRESGAEPGAELAVVRFSQAYPGIDEFVSEVGHLLEQQGGYRITPIQTPDPRKGALVQLDVARAVVAAAPRIIVVGMDTDFTTYYLRMIEAEWPPLVPRPHYVLTHLNQELGLLGEIVRDDDDLRRRLSGTGWGLSPAAAQNLAALERRFERRHATSLDNTQSGYDAFYAAAYALLLADQAHGLRGPELSASLARLGSGVPTNVGPEALRGALGYLLGGESVDLVGASNDLDFGTLDHQTKSDVALWCLSRGADGRLALLPDTGPRWQQASGEISGAYACP